jgi:hypothetical protein
MNYPKNLVDVAAKTLAKPQDMCPLAAAVLAEKRLILAGFC